MKRYSTLLLDSDDTLLDFRRAERTALSQAFAQLGFTLTQAQAESYAEINRSLWKEFERGAMTKPQLTRERFTRLFEQYGLPIDPIPFNDRYLTCLRVAGFPLEGAAQLCRALQKEYALYIITNGIGNVQRRRLALSGLSPYFQEIFISEEIGEPKPSKAFFDAVCERIDERDKSRLLIIGDSLTSDMQGGLNAGIDTCWFNPLRQTADRPVMHEVHSYPQLLALLGVTGS